MTWRRSIAAVLRAWKPLVTYEVLVSALSVVALGPLLVATSYRVIEFTGEPILGNTELAAFLFSPLGLVALVVGLSLVLTLLLIHYSGLIVLIHDALHARQPLVRSTLLRLLAVAPRLLMLALIQVAGAVALTLPVFGLAALVYWLLLSADINYYLAARPPRFWLAATLIGILGLVLSTVGSWFFLRFALAVPACVLEGQSAWGALRSSLQHARGRVLWLLLLIVLWQLLEQVVAIAAIAGLDRTNALLSNSFSDRLPVLVWSTGALLIVDAFVLQFIGACFAIGRAFLVTVEYEHARQSSGRPVLELPKLAPPVIHEPGWIARAAVVAILVVGPLVSFLSAIAISHEFVAHRPVRITAHRAGSAAALENSLAALQLAQAAGADYVEIDVQLTADGQVVLMHDRDLRRMTGDPRNVGDVTLAELNELRLIDSTGPTDEPIPTLAQFLQACNDRIRLNLELKETSRAPGLALAVVEVVREHQFTSRAGASCFRLPPLLEIRGTEPGMPIGMILSAVQGDMTRLPVNFLSLHERLVRAPVVRRAHQKGMEVHAWTVNDRETALRLMDLGCDNLITSDPAKMRAIVDWYSSLGDVERMLLRLRRWMRD